jgi:PAS domain S-box-containing protein
MRKTDEALLRRLVDMAEEMGGVGYWRIDAQSRALTWSSQVSRIYGRPPEAFADDLGGAIDCYHPDDRAPVVAHIEAVLSDGTPFAFEHRLFRPDGEMRHVVAKGAAERDTEGRIVAAFGIVMDRTEAKLKEESLRASEARHRLFADNATDMIMLTDRDGRLTYISPSVARVTGYDPQRLIGRIAKTMIHPDDIGPLEAMTRNIAAGAVPEDLPRVEYRARHRDGHWLWFETHTSVIRDPVTGEPNGVLDVAREITARKALEEALRQRSLEAEAAAVAKSDFLANMSHEIRTPLTAILGFSALLRRQAGLPPEAATQVERIATAGETLLAVVNDVLDFSKLEAGHIELDPHPFDPIAFVNETVDLVANQAVVKGLSLDIALDADLPPMVFADSARLRQVLLNLLGNAIKFTVAGGITVDVRYDGFVGGRLALAVTDTGMGVPADRRDRLFQRFSQVDGSVSRRHGGSGLGLAICKSLTELMGGEIGIDSAEGRGSTFWVTVPAPPSEDVVKEAAAEIEPGAVRARRLLVVDDVAVNRELVRAILTPFGHDITEAASGAEAVELAHGAAFDLILMDLQMPGMDGLAATRAIRASAEPNRATPILALSANVLAEHLAACRAAGMNDHIAKPIDLTDLVMKVSAWSDRGPELAAALAG